MAIIRPFNALRPAPGKVSLVASVPYDVVNTKEARANAEGNPLSFLRVTRSEIEFPDTQNPYTNEIYDHAKKNLNKITTEAPLIMEKEASFYLYSLVMNGRVQTGIAATFSVDDYDSDIIMKHEKTRKEKEDDRTKHIITTEAQTGVVFLTYKGSSLIDEAVQKITTSSPALYDFTLDDGIRHTVWKVPAEYNAVITKEIAGIEKLYIADGHHRAASASRARAEKKKNNPSHTGNEEYNFFISVLFPAGQLHIMPYNRVVKDLNGKTEDEFLSEIGQKFIVEKSEEKEPKKAQTIAMYLSKTWYKLTPRDSVLASNSLSTSVSETLDVSILQNFLLNPVLAIDDPRTNKRVDFIGGIRGTKELEELVDSGKFAVAFSMYPVTVNDLMKISDAGEVMPPKSTWFEPKLRDGLLVHLIG